MSKAKAFVVAGLERGGLAYIYNQTSPIIHCHSHHHATNELFVFISVLLLMYIKYILFSISMKIALFVRIQINWRLKIFAFRLSEKSEQTMNVLLSSFFVVFLFSLTLSDRPHFEEDLVRS